MERKSRGRHPAGEGCGRAKLRNKDLAYIFAMRDLGYKQVAIAAEFGISQTHVSALLAGKGRVGQLHGDFGWTQELRARGMEVPA
ncbi:hypothetical protein [Nitrolancea hollandica]|nr:hypothetical protein [Nitrolancea hollandica]